jgi:hypothetical protein
VTVDGIREKIVYCQANEPFPLKEHFMSSREISRYKYRMHLSKWWNCDDATALRKRVNNTSPYEKNNILVYKPQGCKTVIGSIDFDNLPNSSTLFVYGFQTERQLRELEAGGKRILCIDATYKTNRYDFFILNLLVPDEFNNGYLVAQFITNCLNTTIISFLFPL